MMNVQRGNTYQDYLAGLVSELRKLPKESEFFEFKENDAEPEIIGEYISALSNSAALAQKANAYMVWGIRDASHEIVGTDFYPTEAKVGNEELENWLLRSLVPKIHFRFYDVTIDGQRVVVLEIDRAQNIPVQFKGNEFVRIGSYKKRLKDFPAKERELWHIFDKTPFENLIAAERKSDAEVTELLDYPTYFDLLSQPLPESRSAILSALEADNLISTCPAGGWNITNMGALLFAKRLSDFPRLRRKAMRVVQYLDGSRVKTLKEREGIKGYAAGFEGLIGYATNLLPANEVVGKALRTEERMFPELSVREVIANALIHQDFTQTGNGPMVEIFADRFEVTNPGVTLMDTQRLLDTPPKSRNEGIASMMRRFGVCEERGSGWDKIVHETEIFQLPPPLVETLGESTKVTLFAQRPLTKMDQEERIRAVYLHACLRYVNREVTNNASIRERFRIEAKNSAIASRLIKEAVSAGLIVAYDNNAAQKLMKYQPFWAGV